MLRISKSGHKIERLVTNMYNEIGNNMENAPQNIYLSILTKVVETISEELSIKDSTREYDVIKTLSSALQRCFETTKFINFFQQPIMNEPFKVEVYGETHIWKPDIYVKTDDGYGFFIEVNMNKGFSIRELSLHLYSRLEFLEKLKVLGGLLVYIEPDTGQIHVVQIAKGNELKEVEIYEQAIDNGHGNIAILKANQYSTHPDELLDKAVLQYVGNKPYNQFVDIREENPWVRIVITGINNISYKPFEQHRL